MKSLSIGSPFLSYIQSQNRSQFSPVESTLTMTHSATLALKEFAPRILRDHLKQACESKVTVVIFHSVETLAGFLAKTTCLTADGSKHSIKLIEYCWLEAYQLSMPDKFGMQLVRQTHHQREYHASILPPTLRRVRNHRQDH